MSSRAALLLAALVGAVACHDAPGPAGFWARYHPELLERHELAQDARGGQRTLYWQARDDFRFSVADVMAFAAWNDWTPADGPPPGATHLSAPATVLRFRVRAPGKGDAAPAFAEIANDGTALVITHAWGTAAPSAASKTTAAAAP
ncbi:MAG: hypothetical protein QM704_05220 [Anaeromyxobacteraceae bacterium]